MFNCELKHDISVYPFGLSQSRTTLDYIII